MEAEQGEGWRARPVWQRQGGAGSSGNHGRADSSGSQVRVDVTAASGGAVEVCVRLKHTRCSQPSQTDDNGDNSETTALGGAETTGFSIAATRNIIHKITQKNDENTCNKLQEPNRDIPARNINNKKNKEQMKTQFDKGLNEDRCECLDDMVTNKDNYGNKRD